MSSVLYRFFSPMAVHLREFFITREVRSPAKGGLLGDRSGEDRGLDNMPYLTV